MSTRRVPEEQRREAMLRAAFDVAAREGLAGVTARAVATAAGVSSGLVFFHFASVDGLRAALLDWLLAHTFVAAELPARVQPGTTAAERLFAAVRRDVAALPRARGRVELFFDYWVLGTRDPAVRATIRAALERYRRAFVPLAEAVLAEAPARHAGGGAEGLATVAAAFVEGCALRVVLDPAAFDPGPALATFAAQLGVAVRDAAARAGAADEPAGELLGPPAGEPAARPAGA